MHNRTSEKKTATAATTGTNRRGMTNLTGAAIIMIMVITGTGIMEIVTAHGEIMTIIVAIVIMITGDTTNTGDMTEITGDHGSGYFTAGIGINQPLQVT